jgi:hypothetical protein
VPNGRRSPRCGAGRWSPAPLHRPGPVSRRCWHVRTAAQEPGLSPAAAKQPGFQVPSREPPPTGALQRIDGPGGKEYVRRTRTCRWQDRGRPPAGVPFHDTSTEHWSSVRAPAGAPRACGRAYVRALDRERQGHTVLQLPHRSHPDDPAGSKLTSNGSGTPCNLPYRSSEAALFTQLSRLSFSLSNQTFVHAKQKSR